MSKQKHVIEITPPDYQGKSENMTFLNYVCPVCNGRGYFSEQTDFNEWTSNDCKYCEGTGKVKAEVAIQWKPDYDS